MRKRFSTSTLIDSTRCVPWLAADGPLAYTPENPPAPSGAQIVQTLLWIRWPAWLASFEGTEQHFTDDVNGFDIRSGLASAFKKFSKSENRNVLDG